MAQKEEKKMCEINIRVSILIGLMEVIYISII